MNTETMNIMTQILPPAQPINLNRFKDSLMDWSLILLKAIIEYGFGAHLGAALGYIAGLIIGHHYLNFTNCNTLLSIECFQCSIELPFLLAVCGAIIGLIPGMLCVAAINRSLLYQRVQSLYEQGANVVKISHTLLKSERKIQRVIVKLAEDNE